MCNEIEYWFNQNSGKQNLNCKRDRSLDKVKTYLLDHFFYSANINKTSSRKTGKRKKYEKLKISKNRSGEKDDEKVKFELF